MSKKKNGSYYTPEFLADFVFAHVSPHFQGLKELSLLEPSVGDGSFVRSFNKIAFPKSIKKFSFKAVEKFKPELDKAKLHSITDKKKNTNYSFVKNDFLKFQSTVNRKFSFIAGNPPYIKKSLLNKTQVKICQQIRKDVGLEESSVNNIWPYFLIRGCQMLDDNGVLAFVLPAELLQLNFTEELRGLLTANFQRIEIFTFDDLLFECKGQDTVLLFAYKQHLHPGQYYSHIVDVNQLTSNDFILRQNSSLNITDTKWSHHLLSADDLTFIHKLGNQLHKISNYCESKPGIVTAANKFFIVNEETSNLFNLTKFVKPIIQKGLFVNGNVIFDDDEYQQILREGKPAKLLCIADEDVPHLPASVKKYLKFGSDNNLKSGYKCSKRKNWFVIPNISKASEGFFFRRVNHYPKLLKNNAGILVTDTAYKIEMLNDFSIDNLIYSYYNSLSLAFTELNGRYYGGGVLEITPKEFKNLPVPYISITNNEFLQFSDEFKKKTEINNVLKANDFNILSASLNMNAEGIERIQFIYKQLVAKRFREK